MKKHLSIKGAAFAAVLGAILSGGGAAQAQIQRFPADDPVLDPPPVVQPVGPRIFEITARDTSSAGQQLMTVSWKTDKAADGIVNYGPTVNYGTHKSDFAFTLSHSITVPITVGATSTLIHYALRACTPPTPAGPGICTSTGDLTFKPTTVVGPRIFEITASDKLSPGKLMTVSWKTDKAADGIVNYGPTTSYGTYKSDFAFTLSHSITVPITSGTAKAPTLIHYALRACTPPTLAAKGICTSTGDLTFIPQPPLPPAPIDSFTITGSPVGALVKKIGPCLGYESDGGDKPSVGGSVLIKCPPNAIKLAGNPLIQTTDGTFQQRATDSVGYFKPTGALAYAELREYALGQPEGFKPFFIAASDGQVIISQKIIPCRVANYGVRTYTNVTLDGKQFFTGGDVCPQ